MLELLTGLILGIGLGVVAGLIPGIHTNTLVFLTLPLYFAHSIPATGFAAFIIGIAVTNTFLDFIPGMLLGVPEEDTALSVLPAHQYVQRGRGLEALTLSVYGGAATALLAITLLPILFLLIPVLYPVLQQGMAWILLTLIGFMIWTETHKARAVFVLILAGILGTITLHSHLANQLYILFPLFAGLFGMANIIIALREHTTIPKQKHTTTVDTATITTGIGSGYGAAVIAGFLPGIGSAHAALLADYATNLNLRNFIVALGGINTAELFFSFVAITLIDTARSGAAIAVNHVIPRLTTGHVIQFTGITLVTVGVATVLTIRIGRRVLQAVEHIPYATVMKGAALFLVSASYLATGWFGVLILATSTALGLLPPLLQVRRSQLMNVLLTPTILYYLGGATTLSALL